MGRLNDGFKTLVDFVDTNVGGVIIWEKRVKPPGMIGGGANDTTTMRNTRWRTKQPKNLLDLSEMTCTIAYDTLVYRDLISALQVNQQIVITWPDFAQLFFWGWLDEFQPNEIVEGAQPEAEIKIIPSNQDDNGDEVAPELSEGLDS